MLLRIFGLAALVVMPAEVCPLPAVLLALFFSARIPSLFAVSARSRPLVLPGLRDAAVTVGVLSSTISLFALLCSRFGTLFTLWLAVRLLMSRGTC